MYITKKHELKLNQKFELGRGGRVKYSSEYPSSEKLDVIYGDISSKR